VVLTLCVKQDWSEEAIGVVLCIALVFKSHLFHVCYHLVRHLVVYSRMVLAIELTTRGGFSKMVRSSDSKKTHRFGDIGKLRVLRSFLKIGT